MEILEFVKADDVDPIYFESSYFLVPEDAGKRPYALLSKALEETNYVAIAKLTMHNREYTVFLRPYKGGMMLHTMYYKNEVKDLDNFGRPDVELKDAEVKVAHQLIEALAGDFEPEKYHDTFEDNVKALIKARLEGEEVTPVEKPKKMAPVVDLMAALKESLASLPKKPPPRVEAAQRASEVESGSQRQEGVAKEARSGRVGADVRPVFPVPELPFRIRRAQDMRLGRQHRVVEVLPEHRCCQRMSRTSDR